MLESAYGQAICETRKKLSEPRVIRIQIQRKQSVLTLLWILRSARERIGDAPRSFARPCQLLDAERPISMLAQRMGTRKRSRPKVLNLALICGIMEA